MVVPLLDDGRLVVERQWRYPMARVMLEFPAGKLDAGEAPLACGMRELLEETGYRAAEWARAGILHNAIAYSTEGIEVWFARGLTPATGSSTHGEFLDVSRRHAGGARRAGAARRTHRCQDPDRPALAAERRAGRWPLDWQARRLNRLTAVG